VIIFCNHVNSVSFTNLKKTKWISLNLKIETSKLFLDV
jgi:hypothetical protein